MRCSKCGRDVNFPSKMTHSRYGYGWECRCGWFNKLSRTNKRTNNSRTQYVRGRGCPACGSRDISQLYWERDNRDRIVSTMACHNCDHTWRRVS